MHNKKNRLACSVALILGFAIALLCPALNSAHAQSISVNKVADLSYGNIDFLGSTAMGDITLATNGIIVYGSNTSGSGNGTPGQMEITGTPGTIVTIACANTGTLALPGNGTLTITPVNFIVGATNVGAYNTATECIDLNTSVATHNITATASENTLFIGGKLNTDGQPTHNGVFSSTNSGGVQPAFRVLVQ